MTGDIQIHQINHTRTKSVAGNAQMHSRWTLISRASQHFDIHVELDFSESENG